MSSDREEAWTALIEATPPGWYVGRPSYHEARRQWMLYAFDPSEKAIVGVRKREWEAVADSELGVVQEMTRCLELIKEGKVPK